MAKVDRNTLKSYLETGDYPTEAQFADLVDSFYHVLEDEALLKKFDHIPSIPYKAGWLTVKDGVLYRSNVDQSAGAFDGSKWDAIVGSSSLTIDDISGLQAALDAKQFVLGFTPQNVAEKDTIDGYVGIDQWRIKFRSYASNIYSFFTNASTAVRYYVFQDKDYTVAGLDDIGAAITALQDGVASPGNTLQKLYNLCLGATAQVNVANIAARDAYNIPRLPTNVFVTDDGDGRWALYQATTTGVGATFVKLSDPDLLNAVMSAAQIKVAYESNADTNAFTNALLTKLNGIAAGATANDTDANLKNRTNHSGTQLAATISDFAASARAVVLTGLSTATNAVVTASNTIIEGIGLLQKQVSDLLTSKDDIVAATESLATTGTVTLDFDKKRASAITLSGNTTFALGTVNRGVPKLIRITPNGFTFTFTSVFKVTGTAQAGVVNSVYFLCYDSSNVEVDITQRT